MSKAEFYAFTKKKVVILGIAVVVCQVSLFGAGYLLSTVLRPEPVVTASNGQPCSLPGAAASDQAPGQPTQSAPAAAPATATSAPATAQAAASAEERKIATAATSAVGQPGAAVAAEERSLQRQVAPEFVPPSGAPTAKAPAVAAANAPAGAAGAMSASAAGNGAGAPAAAAATANPRVAAEACDTASDLIPTVATQSDSHKYAVQIGAFLDANNALRLASEFKAKGYQPCIMKAADKQGRRWTVVRMGAFEDVGKASLYARSISGREQTVALVRPADSF